MIHRLVHGPYHNLHLYLSAVAAGLLAALVVIGALLLFFAWLDAGVMATRAEVADLRARVAYLEGRDHPLVERPEVANFFFNGEKAE